VVTPSAQTTGNVVTFNCNYSEITDNSPVTGATVTIYIDGSPNSATYSNGVYIYATKSLSAASHSWYCNANKPQFQPMHGPLMQYTVSSSSNGGGNGGSTNGGSPLMMKTPTTGQAEVTPQIVTGNTWVITVVLIAIIGICIGYFILKEELLFVETVKKKRRK
jgi:hypothetical protein